MKLSGFVGQSTYFEDFRINRLEFNTQLKDNSKFVQLYDIIHQNINKIPHHELGFIFMALRKFDVEVSSPLMRDIYLKLMDNVDIMNSETLSYLSVGLRGRENAMLITTNNRYPWSGWRLALVPTIPRLKYLLETCQSTEELRRIVICFYNLSFLMSDNMMSLLTRKVMRLIKSGELRNPDNLSLLGKLTGLSVTKHDWHMENFDYTLQLLQQYKGIVHHLRPVNATMICKFISTSGEPVSVLYEVYEKLVEVLKNKSYIGNEPMVTVLSALLSVNPSAVPVKHVEEILETVIDSPCLIDHVDDVFKIMKNVGIINNDLVDRFFISAFDSLNYGPEIIRFAERYLHMNSVYTGAYINRDFESKVGEFILDEMKKENQSVFVFAPKAFGSRIAILINFGYVLEPAMIDKFEDFLPNMNAKILMRISKAIDNQWRKYSPGPVPRADRTEHAEMLDKLSVLVDRESEAKFKSFSDGTSTENILDMADLMRNYIYRNDFFDDNFEMLKEKLIKRVNDGNVSSKTVASMCTAINNPRQKIQAPDLLDCFVNFYLSRPDPRDLHCNTIYKLLEICYDSGHVPDKRFLDLFCDILPRDIDSLSGFRTLTIAFMLCCYDSVSRPLITAIFSNEFMSRLDNEMELASDRKHYPKLLRRALMVLNRAVVLRNPEFGVPWFHKKYCLENEMMLRAWTPKDPQLKEEVCEVLTQVLGGWRYFREGSMTSFANYIDFEVHYDAAGAPVDLTSTTAQSENITKCAIQVIPSSMMTVDTRNIAGYVASNMKELEIQGYKVVTISPFTWNSLQMGDTSSRKKYLNNSIKETLSL